MPTLTQLSILCGTYTASAFNWPDQYVSRPLSGPTVTRNSPILPYKSQLASCLSYARALLEYVIFILWVRSVSKMLLSVKFAKDKVLTFLILREKC